MLKKEHARTAAAKYSTNIVAAVLEYISMTSKTLSSIEKQNQTDMKILFDDAQNEMLNILEPYRHPMKDPETERRIFFAEFESEFQSTGFNDPKWLVGLKKTPGIEQSIMDDAIEYVIEAEKERLLLREIKAELLKYRVLFDQAHRAYLENIDKGKETASAARASVGVLGFSQKHGRPKEDKTNIYESYLLHVRHEGRSRFGAIEIVKDEFGYASEKSVVDDLIRVRTNIKNKWKSNSIEDYERLQIGQYFKGFIPTRRELDMRI